MNILKIAIVDDDIYICSKLYEYCSRFFDTYRLQIDDFSNGREFINELQNGTHYDIVFMDIQMTPINGIEAGQTLRQKDKNHNTYLVYISSYTDQLLPLFQNRPFDFIQKPLTYTSFAETAAQLVNQLIDSEKSIFIQHDHSSERIQINDIIFAEIYEGRKSKIKFTTGELITSERLSSLFNRLKKQSNSFIQIHKSYFINIKHIDKFTKDTINLSDNTILSISARFRTETNKRLIEHFLNSENI